MFCEILNTTMDNFSTFCITFGVSIKSKYVDVIDKIESSICAKIRASRIESMRIQIECSMKTKKMEKQKH